MKPEEWNALQEAEKDIWRRQFRKERRQIYTGRGRRQHGDFQKGLIFWFAGDVYRVLIGMVGLGVLFVGALALAFLLGL